jgi:hypothetical protein
MSEHQPIDLDDLRRVGVWVREKTDDNWLADMVEIACDEIARLREERRWVSVGERLPDEGVKVLAFDPLFPVIQSARRDGHGWNCEGLDFLTPTHWMPLPPGPEGDG